MKLKLTEEAFLHLGTQVITKATTRDSSVDDRTYKAFFGVSAGIVAECWEAIECSLPKGKHPKHILWALLFMKLYLPEDATIAILGTSKPTMRKWVWTVIRAIAGTDIICFDKRKRNLPKDALATISVDGTDFKIQEPFPFNKKWCSHKFNGAALKYEVAISIFSGDIVWVYGPHRGAKHDITIFKENLRNKLDNGEMIEGDKGYIDGNWIRSKEDYSTVKERREKGRLRNRHETVNRRFKCWSILKQEYRHDIKKHEYIFRSIANLTQMGIDAGDCLFGCEPTARKKAEHDKYNIHSVDLSA